MSKLSLNQIVAEVTTANEADGVINRHAAITSAVPRVLADEDMTETCVRSHLSKLIANNAKNRKRREGKADPDQFSFFGLRDTHVIGDDDGESLIKHTSVLSRAEFAQLIDVRQKQLHDDYAYLSKLRSAEMATRDIWERHPDWRWGQVEAEYGRAHPRPVAA